MSKVDWSEEDKKDIIKNIDSANTNETGTLNNVILSCYNGI